MRSIGVVTTARSDYGIYRPVLDAMERSSTLEYGLFVSGAHLAEKYGMTIREIEAADRPVWARIPMLDESGGDTDASVARAMGRGVSGFADALAQKRPDILMVLGDRFDMFAAVAASVPLNLPIAHIHGGEITFGAIDEVFRHAITKMAHLHFPATEEYAARIRQMGEEDWRITVSGAPSLDNLTTGNLHGAAELETVFGIPFSPPPIVVTLHSSTRGLESTRDDCAAMMDALRTIEDRAIIFTAPNADPGGLEIRAQIAAFVAERTNAHSLESFGSAHYLSALGAAAAVVGNSSSGLIETPSFRLPTVNIGDRQDGRTRARNVIDVAPESGAIGDAIRRALDPAFRETLSDLANPYGDGNAASRIVEVLETVELDDRLLAKRFADL
ncbi:UDP-N-acetylglucosamine 2-epimerase [Hoeflea sp.]|uniref:UDP-N-acetylglucosamine 2-epimerase n=1 Tax=Hoeflea sp. TaxID=1940281 RepID=UPI003BB0C0DC